MDPFDEFEFKPLTEGLGFHKKKVDLKKETKESKTFDDDLSKFIPEAPPEMDSYTPPVSASIPASAPKKSIIEPQVTLKKAELSFKEDTPPAATEAQQEVERILADFKSSRQKAEQESQKEKIKEPTPIAQWRKATPSFMAFVMDLMAVAALNILGFIILLLVTKVDLTGNLREGDPILYASVGAMLIGIYWIYMTASRCFTGHSLGEWAFDYRTGTTEELKTKTYSLRVAWRSLLVIMTGGLILPILSYLFGRDLTGDLSGVHLTKKGLHGAGL